MLTALFAAGVLASAPASAFQDPPLTRDQSISCAVAMWVLSEIEASGAIGAELRDGVSFFLRRAEGIGGLSKDQVYALAAEEALDLRARLRPVPDTGLRVELILKHGPGMDRCRRVAAAGR